MSCTMATIIVFLLANIDYIPINESITLTPSNPSAKLSVKSLHTAIKKNQFQVDLNSTDEDDSDISISIGKITISITGMYVT